MRAGEGGGGVSTRWEWAQPWGMLRSSAHLTAASGVEGTGAQCGAASRACTVAELSSVFPRTVPVDGRDFRRKGALAICTVLSLFSPFLQTRGGRGKPGPPRPLARSQAHTQSSASQLHVCGVQGFVGVAGRQSKYNLTWKYTFYNFSF